MPWMARGSLIPSSYFHFDFPSGSRNGNRDWVKARLEACHINDIHCFYSHIQSVLQCHRWLEACHVKGIHCSYSHIQSLLQFIMIWWLPVMQQFYSLEDPLHLPNTHRTYKHAQTHTHTYTYTHMHKHTHTHTHTHTHIHTYTYTYRHMHTHKHKKDTHLQHTTNLHNHIHVLPTCP